jgi:hypothetical protein
MYVSSCDRLRDFCYIFTLLQQLAWGWPYRKQEELLADEVVLSQFKVILVQCKQLTVTTKLISFREPQKGCATKTDAALLWLTRRCVNATIRVYGESSGSVTSDNTAMEGGGRSLPMKNKSAVYIWRVWANRRDRTAFGRNGVLEQTASI